MSAQTINWEQYQQLPAGKRSRPLTDAEYAALTKQQRIAGGLDENDEGAPANFNGPVFPNPTHIQPRADTDPAIDPTRLPEGVTFQRQNFSGTPQMDVSNPAAADVQPEMGREVAANFGKKMSAQPIDFSKYEQAAPPGGNQIDFSKYEQGANSGNAAQPSVMQVLTQPTDKTDKEYMGYTGPAGVVGATVHGLSDVAQGTKDAIKGVYESFATPPQDAGEKGVFLLGGPPALQTYRMLRGLGHTASDATHVAAAIHDINQSPDPAGTYANAAEKTAAQGAGQALVAIGAEGAAKVPGAISDVAAGVKPALAKAGNAATAVGESLDPDIVGLVSPRAAHGLRLAAKVGKVATKLGGEAATEAAAGAGELDATGENRDYAGAPAPKPAPVLDATGENKPFAGGMDEYVAPKPKAPRTIVTDPATGRPEFSDVVETKQQAAAPIETKAPPTETPAPQVAPQGTPAETPTKPQLVSNGTENGLDTYTIKSSGRSVGEVMVGFDKSQPGPPQPYINNISIVDDFRGQGLGREVLPQLADKYGSLTSDPGGNTTPAAHGMWKATPGARQITSSYHGEPINIWKIGGESATPAETPGPAADDLVTVYHGTTAGNAKSIVNSGLRSENGLFVTTDPGTARSYGDNIVQAKVPRAWLGEEQFGAHVLEHGIPPEFITKIHNAAETPGPAADDLESRLAANVQKLQAEEAAPKADEDLTDILEKSRDQAIATRAVKDAGKTIAVPGQGEVPRFVYRARDVGEEGVPLNNQHAQAGSDFGRIMQYAEPGQRSPMAGQVVRIDLSKLQPKDFTAIPYDGGHWVKFTRPLSEDEVTPFAGQMAGAK